MNKKALLIVAIIAVILVAVYARNSSTKAPIRIGYIGPQTGDLQAWGEESRNSVALAVKEINDSGGVDGRQLQIVYEDGGCSAAKAVSAARKLISVDGVKILIAWCSQEALSVAPIALESKVIEFVPDATAQELTNINEYVFRISPSDRIASKVLADAVTADHSKVAILTENSAYSISLRDNFLKNISSSTEIVFNESFDSGLRDFRSLVAKIKASKPEAVFVNGNTTIPAALIVKQLHEARVNAPYYGAYFGSDPDFAKIAGTAAEDFTYVEFIADEGRASVKKFLAAYKAEYGQDSPHPQFAALSYDAPYVLKNAIENVGADPESLKVYFKNLKQVDSVLGTFTITNGDIDGTIFKLRKIKNAIPVSI